MGSAVIGVVRPFGELEASKEIKGQSALFVETCWEKVLREEPFYTQKSFCPQPAPLHGTKISSPVIARKVAAKARNDARQNSAKNVRRSIQSMEDEVALER